MDRNSQRIHSIRKPMITRRMLSDPSSRPQRQELKRYNEDMKSFNEEKESSILKAFSMNEESISLSEEPKLKKVRKQMGRFDWF